MPFDTSGLPAINASLNAVATVLLTAGWITIRRDNRRAHGYIMATALSVSAVFLVLYLIHKYFNGTTRFTEPAHIKPLYLTILITHLILAMAILPLIGKTVYHASKRQWDKHRRIARWTLPIWLYVSITGVIVYFFLYQWYPQH